MAKFFRAENGIAWLEISWFALYAYSGNATPTCDECLKSLIGIENVVLIPLLNEAFCPECGPKRVSNCKNYPEDRHIAQRREQFWLDYFGLHVVEGVN